MTALQCHDRLLEARALIKQHGRLIPNRFGELKPNPAVVIEKDARAAMLLAFKQLHLDLEPRQAIGRPPGS